MENRNIVEFNNVSFKYDKKNVLSNFSCCFEKSKVYSLIGPNGSGKSTIAKLIIGLLEPQEGNINCFGLKVNEENIYDIRNKTSIVFQNPDNQFIGSTVEDDIAFGLENRCIKQEDMKKIVYEYAKKVSMDKYLNVEPSELSGGQKQRVAIAGALATSCDLLILDEATSMLDPQGKKEINELIEKIHENNKDLTIIKITHHIDEIINSDEVIILNNGVLITKDSPVNILKNKKLLTDNNISLPFTYKVIDKLNENGFDFDYVLDLKDMKELL